VTGISQSDVSGRSTGAILSQLDRIYAPSVMFFTQASFRTSSRKAVDGLRAQRSHGCSLCVGHPFYGYTRFIKAA
jgi:hypothetical protein